jgi:carbon starvation protein CstA
MNRNDHIFHFHPGFNSWIPVLFKAWSYQTLAVVVLWTITVYLSNQGKLFWITLIPAVFMSAVCISYIFFAPEGFGFSKEMAYSIGVGSSLAFLSGFFIYHAQYRKRNILHDAV